MRIGLTFNQKRSGSEAEAELSSSAAVRPVVGSIRMSSGASSA